ncbi:monooxygenase [Nitrogeniibacter mangrovi]|uniref:Monooxygenase n=1 Tax=Nitrogeniibacter mangrovi TaxID=2016596 RepID=A0A6C1AYE1_9RHOO|nr:MmoB/DmpM family protein [Nitrogeniibacter mangrovi]QID16382.1 monooxygenase [Nitrogeniibacter mangrovi]
MSNVFIALQANEETRPVVEAIVADNPLARIEHQPAMVRIEAPDRLTIRRDTVEAQIGRAYDLQELHINLITLSGNVDEDEDTLSLVWHG